MNVDGRLFYVPKQAPKAATDFFAELNTSQSGLLARPIKDLRRDVVHARFETTKLGWWQSRCWC